jgi:hypothetical protein
MKRRDVFSEMSRLIIFCANSHAVFCGDDDLLLTAIKAHASCTTNMHLSIGIFFKSGLAQSLR